MSAPVPKVQHVSIPRPPGSGEIARRFYTGLLGLEQLPVPRAIEHLDLVWFALGDQELHLFAEEPVDDRSMRHFCLLVTDQAAMRRQLEGAGYEPWDPEPIPGRPRFFCRDPFGNIIEFTTSEEDYRVAEEQGLSSGQRSSGKD